jgi:hypothetical protein
MQFRERLLITITNASEDLKINLIDDCGRWIPWHSMTFHDNLEKCIITDYSWLKRPNTPEGRPTPGRPIGLAGGWPPEGRIVNFPLITIHLASPWSWNLPTAPAPRPREALPSESHSFKSLLRNQDDFEEFHPRPLLSFPSISFQFSIERRSFFCWVKVSAIIRQTLNG